MMKFSNATICLYTGDMYENAEFELEEEQLMEFLKIKIDDKDIYISPAYIVSFEDNHVSEHKPPIILRRSSKEKP